MTSLLMRCMGAARCPTLKLPIASFGTSSPHFAVNEPTLIRKDLALLKQEEVEKKQKLAGYITIKGQENISVVTGVPEEHIKTRTVRIYEPVKNCMQSGTDNIGHWEMEFDNRERWENPLMGWCSSGDPLSNMKLQFNDKEEAIAHCEKNGWNYFIDATTQKPPRAKSYANNFHWSRRSRTSTK